jgi:hypothetical protein
VSGADHKKLAIRKCEECEEPFRPKRRANARLCSDRCRQRSSRKSRPPFVPPKPGLIPPLDRGVDEVAGSRQAPFPPVEAPLPLEWEIWLAAEEIERGEVRMARNAVIARWTHFLKKYPAVVPQLMDIARRLVIVPMTNRNRDPFPDTLDILLATTRRNVHAATYALRRLHESCAEEEIDVSTATAITARLDRQAYALDHQADTLVRVELIQHMYGETLDHVRRTVDELVARFPEDARI